MDQHHQPQWDVVVVGAGAAGLLAAARAAERGCRTLLVEKNRKPGVKILMSGGTRCNLTQATDARGIVREFGRQGPFLHSALAALGPSDLVALIEAEGVPTKVEPTGKIFPTSDRAVDVLRALTARLTRSGCTWAWGEPLLDLTPLECGFQLTTAARQLTARQVIVTTGGQSYPGCGTTGDGYHWARRLGHTIVEPRPALVPLLSEERWVRSLKGVTVPDVSLEVVETTGQRRRTLAGRRGSLLFTHFGLSGPVALDVSRAVSGHPRPRTLSLICDWLPGDSQAACEQALRSACADSGKRQLPALVPETLPRRLAEALVAQAGLAPQMRVAELTRAGRTTLTVQLKQTSIALSGTLGFEKAEVTAGGVSLEEIDSRTMQSKRLAGLFVAGELLDLDGPIGGYNFQSAFSTGWLAGSRVGAL